MTTRAATAADRKTTLPTMPLLAGVTIACTVAGGLWAAGAAALGHGAPGAMTGLLAAGVVAAASIMSILVIQPWRAKSLARWPAVWVGGSFLRMLLALAGTFLLYSATPYGSVGFWLATALAYAAVMVCETRIYVKAMSRFGPEGPGSSAPE